MPYQSLTNDKTVDIDLPDASFQCPSISQLVELNYTRRILLVLTGTQFVVSLLIIFGVIYAYIFGYVLDMECFNSIVQLLPILSCICFLIGALAADRNHIKGLLFFSKLVMLNIIVTYLIVTFYIIVPIYQKKYLTTIITKIMFALTYQIIFCLVSFLPAYTIRMAEKLSKLLINNGYSSTK